MTLAQKSLQSFHSRTSPQSSQAVTLQRRRRAADVGQLPSRHAIRDDWCHGNSNRCNTFPRVFQGTVPPKFGGDRHCKRPEESRGRVQPELVTLAQKSLQAFHSRNSPQSSQAVTLQRRRRAADVGQLPSRHAIRADWCHGNSNRCNTFPRVFQGTVPPKFGGDRHCKRPEESRGRVQPELVTLAQKSLQSFHSRNSPQSSQAVTLQRHRRAADVGRLPSTHAIRADWCHGNSYRCNTFPRVFQGTVPGPVTRC